MDEDIRKWVDISEYDLKTAEAMLKGGRYLYVLFCCQQALEKMLKAYIVYKKRIFPPRSHNLLKLAKEGNLKLDKQRIDFLDRLNTYYIESRYPEEVQHLVVEATRELATRCLSRTKEQIEWLKRKLN